MISETSFAKRFTSFWNELLPNAKNYVRLVNAARREVTHKPLDAPERRQNTALVNTFAFNLFRLLTRERTDISLLHGRDFRESAQYANCMASSVTYLRRFGSHQPHELPLSVQEWAQVLELTRLINVRYNWRADLVIDPAFDGCGYLNPAAGDIFAAGTLIEIKSGERSFSLQDFRQILVYCTLNHYSKAPFSIGRVELFNPRMGVKFSESIDEFAKNLSAVGPLQLFSEVASFVSDVNFVEVLDN